METQLFYDENNNPIEFVVDAKFTVDDTDYVAMSLANEEDSPEYILKITKDSDGNDLLEGIDDEELKIAIESYEDLIKNQNL